VKRAAAKRVHSSASAHAAALLVAAPELAVLALLDRALVIAEQTLLAEHPRLAVNLRAAEPELQPREIARRLLLAIRPLRGEITRYRRAVREHLIPPPDDALPF
jgi:hypothetical protein